MNRQTICTTVQRQGRLEIADGLVESRDSGGRDVGRVAHDEIKIAGIR